MEKMTMARKYVDVIEAEAAIKDLFADMPRIEFMGNRRRWREENEQYLRCLDAIRSLSTADVVERRVGKWVDYPIADGCLQCSACGILRFGESNYCPNCGAEMDGGKDDDRNG